VVLTMKLTIITICFNNLQDVINTCNSVDQQITQPYEHLIIDGSTNNEIKNHFQNLILPSYRKTFHEKDKGIADAFNKGIAKANGDFIQFLNSGDVYFNSNSLNEVITTLQNNTNANWLHGKLLLQRGGQLVSIGKPFHPKLVYRGMRATFHPTMFVKSSLFEKYGYFNSQLNIAMDYDFLVRIREEPFVYLDKTIVKFDNTGISSTNYLASLNETKKVYEKHCGQSFKLKIWQLRLKILHWLLSSKLGKWLYQLKTKIKLENI
jgi:glycosyltransferase involved in cell wall biosynthesis